MKRSNLLIIVVLLLTSSLFAQGFNDPAMNQNEFEGGFGVTFIDGKSYTTFSLTPDLSFGKFGVGLNIELMFNNADGFKFRKESWDSGAGVLRAIRYLRYGYKGDPFYTRIGSLDGATLGHGFIMWYYTNEANYDYRKIGLQLDLDFDTFGFETMTSNLGRLEIFGGRAYYRPLLNSGIPVINTLEVGATYVGDADPDSRTSTSDGISEYGLDIGLPWLQYKYINSTVYYDYAKIPNFGSGSVVGINFNFPGVAGLLSLDARLEKRFLGEEFLPNFFNTLYEVERNLDKRTQLQTAGKNEGVFGQLVASILGKMQIVGSYQRLNGVSNSGILHFETRLPDLIPSVRVMAAYDKAGIETFKDVTTLDNRSVATAEVGYRTMQFVYLSMLYRWTFTETAPGVFTPQERVEPRVSFVYNF
jgi:hypothetical protein